MIRGQSDDTARDLIIKGRTLSEREIRQRRTINGKHIGHYVVPETGIQGKSRRDLPVLLKKGAGIKFTVLPLIGRFLVGYKVDRGTAFRERLVLDEVEYTVEVVRWAIERTALCIVFADIQLLKAKLEGVRFH